MEKKKETFKVGHATVNLEIEVEDGKKWDTKVEIGGELLCFISGPEIDNFKTELNDLVEKHRI